MGNLWSAQFANDIIVVKQWDDTLACSAVNVRFPNQDDVTNWDERNVTVSIKNTVGYFSLNELNPGDLSNDRGFRFPSRYLEEMELHDDLNDITFTLGEDVEVKARLFLWHSDSRIVITDVDGTITKSDVRGLFSSVLGYDWTRDGVCHLFSAIERNGYKVIYLTGRPVYLGEATRSLLDDMLQDDEFLPEGPVIVSPDGWRAACNREVLERAPYKDFKIRMLKEIRELFPCLRSPFYAGFGNGQNDERTYLELEIPCKRIFHLWKEVIVVKCGNELVASFFNNYKGFSSFVDEFFPPVKESATTHHFDFCSEGQRIFQISVQASLLVEWCSYCS